MLFIAKKTLNLIVAKGYDCILKVKKNQPTLYKEVLQTTQYSPLLDQVHQCEKNRGRLEKRTLEVYAFPDSLKEVWQKMQIAIKLTRKGQRDGKDYFHENYYISTLVDPASELQNLIRSYWKVENQVHYVKDVDYLEDKHRMKRHSIAANLSIMRGCAISLIRAKYGNTIKEAQEELWNNPEKMVKLLE